jgi:hypothetical protein
MNMTGRELRVMLESLGWDKDILSRHLGINRTSVQRWMSGVYTVPEHVAAWLGEVFAAQRAGDMARYNGLIAALPEGWKGANHVRNRPHVDVRAER